MKVELKPHVGRSVVSKRLIEHPQWQVFVDGRAMGFLGKRPGSHLSMHVRLADMHHKELLEKVSKEAEFEVTKICQPANVPPEVLESWDKGQGDDLDDGSENEFDA